MRRPRCILAAIKDPAASGDSALTKAAQLCGRMEARLELFHDIALPVWPELLQSKGQSAAEWQKQVRKQRLEQLERLAEPLRRSGLEVKCSAEWDHPPHEAIIRRAMKCGAELIVANRHRGHYPARWLFRYTDWELLRLSTAPVLIVSGDDIYHRPVVLAAVDPTHAHDKPAVLDEEIAGGARLLANALGGRVHLVHAVPPEPALAFGGLDGLVADPTFSRRTRRLASQRVARLAKRYRVGSKAVQVMPTFPDLAVQEAARECDASIVVLGAVARRGLKQLAFGNTAERLISQLRCDLLIVKPPRFKTSVGRTRREAEYLSSLSYAA